MPTIEAPLQPTEVQAPISTKPLVFPGPRPRAPLRGLRRWLAILLGLAAAAFAVSWALTDYYTIEVGPLNLPAHGTHDRVQQPAPVKVALPVDGWIRGLSFDFVGPNDELLPAQMLHHVNLILPERRDLFSPTMLRIAAAGTETPAYGLPFIAGVRVHPGDSLLLVAMVHNPTGKAYRNVRLRVRLTVTSATHGFRALSLQPMYLDVMPPAGIHSYDLPPGRSVKSWEGRPAVAVRLLAAGSHLHKYGKALRLEDASTGQLIWEAHPRLDGTGEVVGMPRGYFLPFGVRLEPTHTYRISAEYDNPTGRTIPDGAMGALGAVVLQDSGSAWPAVDRSDSVYQRDLQVATGRGAHHHQHQPMTAPTR
jgi:hypothetical protein